MNLKEIAEKAGRPIIIKNHDAVVNRNFKSIEKIKKEMFFDTHYSVGFLIEMNDRFVKFASSYTTKKYDHPCVYDIAHIEAIHTLTDTPTKIIKLDERLPDIVYLEWEDHQAAQGKISKKEILDRNVLKKAYSIGFLLLSDDQRIIISEELALETDDARTTHVIYPKYKENMINLYVGEKIYDR
ncbi:hypothetical protein HYW61_01460 [candidate division WWE3 bacterium]|nr:hypothetical protein [candidate division WWE3 bacterium]